MKKRQSRGNRDICWCHLQDALRRKNYCSGTGKQPHCKVSTKASNSLTFFSWTASFSGNESWKGKERHGSGPIHSRQKEILNTLGKKKSVSESCNPLPTLWAYFSTCTKPGPLWQRPAGDPEKGTLPRVCLFCRNRRYTRASPCAITTSCSTITHSHHCLQVTCCS